MLGHELKRADLQNKTTQNIVDDVHYLAKTYIKRNKEEIILSPMTKAPAPT